MCYLEFSMLRMNMLYDLQLKPPPARYNRFCLVSTNWSQYKEDQAESQQVSQYKEDQAERMLRVKREGQSYGRLLDYWSKQGSFTHYKMSSQSARLQLHHYFKSGSSITTTPFFLQMAIIIIPDTRLISSWVNKFEGINIYSKD